MLFRGRHEHAVDAKGRTSFPSRFRDVLQAQGDERIILTSALDPCLVLYPMQEWLAFEERLSRLPQFDASVALLRRVVVSGAVELEFDKLGRMLIPSALRRHAGIEREALFAGMGKNIELWAAHRFEALTSDVLLDEEKKRAVAARLAELGL